MNIFKDPKLNRLLVKKVNKQLYPEYQLDEEREISKSTKLTLVVNNKTKK